MSRSRGIAIQAAMPPSTTRRVMMIKTRPHVRRRCVLAGSLMKPLNVQGVCQDVHKVQAQGARRSGPATSLRAEDALWSSYNRAQKRSGSVLEPEGGIQPIAGGEIDPGLAIVATAP